MRRQFIKIGLPAVGVIAEPLIRDRSDGQSAIVRFRFHDTSHRISDGHAGRYGAGYTSRIVEAESPAIPARLVCAHIREAMQSIVVVASAETVGIDLLQEIARGAVSARTRR